MCEGRRGFERDKVEADETLQLDAQRESKQYRNCSRRL